MADEGIEWSTPVLVERGGDGALMVRLPPKAIQRMAVGEGDVVSFTAFRNGGIEVWSIKKSPYSSLDDAEVADDDLQVAEGGTVVELDEGDALAVSPGLDPAVRLDGRADRLLK